MRKVLVIGIGPGDPDQVTVQAIKGLNRTDVFFVMDKGTAKADLVRLRLEICERYLENRSYRFVEVEDPKREDATTASYKAGVDAWHRRRAEIYERLIRDELDEGMCGAFLVWGDPSLYDSTLRIVDQVLERGTVAFDHEVIPGISSVQALATRHRIVLNRIGEPVHVTTGRRLAEDGLPRSVETGGSVVVMLDGEGAFRLFADRADLQIYWGANLGTADEILISGRLCDVVDEIASARTRARQARGWMMDVYCIWKGAARDVSR